MKKEKKAVLQIFLLLFCMLAVLLTSSIVFYLSNKHTNRQAAAKTDQMLEQYVAQQTAYMDTVLQERFHTLEVIASSLEKPQADGKNIVSALKNSNILSSGYLDFILADSQGAGITGDGVQVHIGEEEYFLSALSGENAISAPFVSPSGKSDIRMILAIPVKQADGKITGVLCGSCSAEAFGKMLLKGGAPGSGYSMLVDRNGGIVMLSDESGIHLEQGKLFDAENAMAFLDGNSADSVMSALLQENRLTSLVSDGAKEIYITQIPFGYNGWSFFSASDREYIDAASFLMKNNGVWMNAIAVCTFVLCLVCLWRILLQEKGRLQADNERMKEETLKLKLSEERYRLLVQDSDVIIFEVNLLEKTANVNENFERMFGGVPRFDYFQSGYRIHPDQQSTYQKMVDEVIQNGESVTSEFQYRDKNGTYVWFQLRMSGISDERGNVIRVLGRLMNIDREKREKDVLEFRAQTDSMTKLYNKAAAEALISQTLTEDAGRSHAILIVDIDDLKTINDMMGHMQGDKAIRMIANSLKRQFRDTDIIGRIGGDEFMVCLKGVGDQAKAVNILNTLAHRTAGLRIGENNEVPLHCSIGGAISKSGDRFQDLYHKADVALYQAKRSGKNGFAFYEPEMEQKEYQYVRQQQTSLSRFDNYVPADLGKLIRAVSRVYSLIVSINLTLDRYRLMECDSSTVWPCTESGQYSDFLEAACGTIHPDERDAVRELFSREALLSLYGEGRTSIAYAARQSMADGEFRWIHMEMIFTDSGKKEEVSAILLVESDPQK